LLFGTTGKARQVFFYGLAAMALIVGAVNVVNVTTLYHEQPFYGAAAPIVWESSSWASFLLFGLVPWLAYRFAPPDAEPRWRLFMHVPAAVLFSALHVAGFVGLRKFIYWLVGSTYGYRLAQFPYELRKDVFGYVLTVGAFWIAARLLAQGPQQISPEPRVFDIRDGARLTRVRLADVLAIGSAGNYVEFMLRDGRKLLMRSPLSALEAELRKDGFVRTHRSWVVNAGAVTGLKPEGSGDYTVELGSVAVPLSRRYPEALVQLRGA